MSELGDKQFLFADLVFKLQTELQLNTFFKYKFGETRRGMVQAEVNAMSLAGRNEIAEYIKEDWPILARLIRENPGKGIRRSLHNLGLAIDIQLFKKVNDVWVYCEKSAEYEPVGTFWEGLHPEARWGGRFGDGGHFSIAYQGIK